MIRYQGVSAVIGLFLVIVGNLSGARGLIFIGLLAVLVDLWLMPLRQVSRHGRGRWRHSG